MRSHVCNTTAACANGYNRSCPELVLLIKYALKLSCEDASKLKIVPMNRWIFGSNFGINVG